MHTGSRLIVWNAIRTRVVALQTHDRSVIDRALRAEGDRDAESRFRYLLVPLLLFAVFASGSLAQDATPEATMVPADTTAALNVNAFSTPMIVAGSDGMDHIEYDLMFSNVFASPVTLTRIEAIGPDGAVLLDLQGDALTANTKPLLPTETTNSCRSAGR